MSTVAFNEAVTNIGEEIANIRKRLGELASGAESQDSTIARILGSAEEMDFYVRQLTEGAALPSPRAEAATSGAPESVPWEQHKDLMDRLFRHIETCHERAERSADGEADNPEDGSLVLSASTMADVREYITMIERGLLGVVTDINGDHAEMLRYFGRIAGGLDGLRLQLGQESVATDG